MELVAEAGYTDSKTTAVKFQKGFDLQIQNTIAMMAYGHPSDASPEAWYEAAKNVDQNHAANEAFKLAYQAPGPVLVRPTSVPVRVPAQSIIHLQQVAHTHPILTSLIPMEIDGS